MLTSKKYVIIFLLPALALLFFNSIAPTLYALWLSLNVYYLIAVAPPKFAAFGMYLQVLRDAMVQSSLGRTFLFTFLCLAVEVPLGIGIALLVTSDVRGRNFIKTLMAVPILLPAIVVGAIWFLMTLPGRGILPYMLSYLGIDLDLGNHAEQAFAMTVIMDAWHWAPFLALLFAAGIASIPVEYYRSALVDGAGPFMRFRYIILPGIRPVLVLGLMLRTMDAFKIFDEVWFLTGGGPGTATRYASIHLVRLVLAEWNMGAGAALSLILLYLALMISLFIFWIATGLRRE